MPVGISAIVSVEGENNFQENYSGSFGVVVSRVMAQDRLALYATPMLVYQHRHRRRQRIGDTGFLGLGGRVRFLESTYGVFEVTPRIGGFKAQDTDTRSRSRSALARTSSRSCFRTEPARRSGSSPMGAPAASSWLQSHAEVFLTSSDVEELVA